MSIGSASSRRVLRVKLSISVLSAVWMKGSQAQKSSPSLKIFEKFIAQLSDLQITAKEIFLQSSWTHNHIKSNGFGLENPLILRTTGKGHGPINGLRIGSSSDLFFQKCWAFVWLSGLLLKAKDWFGQGSICLFSWLPKISKISTKFKDINTFYCITFYCPAFSFMKSHWKAHSLDHSDLGF